MKFYLSILFLEYFFFDIQLCSLAHAEPLIGDNVAKVEPKNFKKDKLSSVVSLSVKKDEFYEEYTHFCTGVLITNKFVLTAAHCFMGKLWGEIQIIAGSVDLREGTKYFPEKWITYDQWAKIRNESKAFPINDIAIIKLSEKPECPKKYVPVPALSNKENHELIGKDVQLVGWGTTKESPIYASRYLNKVDIKVMSNTDCELFARKLAKRTFFISSQYFCTKGEPYALVGLGDSGGPVMRKNVVLGITTGVCPFNYTCDWSQDEINKHKVNLHTGIYPYRKFIHDVLKNYDSLIV